MHILGAFPPSCLPGRGEEELEGPGHLTEVLHVAALCATRPHRRVEGTFCEGAAHVTETAEVSPLRETRG